MKRKIVVVASALLIVLAGFAISKIMGSGKEQSKQKKDFSAAKYVFTDTVRYRDYPATVNAYGTLKAKNKISVFAEVPGIMLNTGKEFRVGNSFQKGETLIKIDDREISLQILSAKSDLITAITNLLPDLKSDYKDSYDNWKSYLDDFELDGNIKSIPDFANTREKYFLSNRGVLKLYYNIRNLELRKEKHTIIAPFSGSVTESIVNYGAMINMGQRLGTFAGLSNYEVELSVIQDDMPFISIGNKISLYSGLSEKILTGRITRIGDYIDPATQSVKVYAGISGSELKDGMYLNAEIEGNVLNDVYKIPRKSIYNNNYVFLVRDSILDQTKVNIIKLSDEYAFIKGLDSNQIVVNQALVDPELGTKVKSIITNK